MSENTKKAGDEYRKKMEAIWEDVKKKHNLDNDQLSEIVRDGDDDDSKPLIEWLDRIGKLQCEIESKYSVYINHDEDNIEIEDYGGD